MNIGRAVAVFCDLDNEQYSTVEKAIAIHKVTHMPTHNGIKKEAILNATKYLWNQIYEKTTEKVEEFSLLEAIKQLDIIIGTEKVLIQHATMGEYQYSKKIEALEIAKKALEKLISKKPKYEPYYSDDEGKWITDDAYCPNCNKHFDMFREFKSYYAKENKCCSSCGQALDWSDT